MILLYVIVILTYHLSLSLSLWCIPWCYGLDSDCLHNLWSLHCIWSRVINMKQNLVEWWIIESFSKRKLMNLLQAWQNVATEYRLMRSGRHCQVFEKIKMAQWDHESFLPGLYFWCKMRLNVIEYSKFNCSKFLGS